MGAHSRANCAAPPPASGPAATSEADERVAGHPGGLAWRAKVLAALFPRSHLHHLLQRLNVEAWHPPRHAAHRKGVAARRQARSCVALAARHSGAAQQTMQGSGTTGGALQARQHPFQLATAICLHEPTQTQQCSAQGPNGVASTNYMQAPLRTEAWVQEGLVPPTRPPILPLLSPLEPTLAAVLVRLQGQDTG